jgi:hypothetical protein
MSENLALLQQLAQKPSVRAWFLGAFSLVRLKITDTGEEFTIINRDPDVEVVTGFRPPEQRRKGFLDLFGLNPSSMYVEQFVIPLKSESIRGLVNVFSDDVVDMEEEYRIVSFLVQPLLAAALSMPLMRNPLMLRFFRIDPFWQQALLDPDGKETQQLTAIFAHRHWLLIPGYHGKPRHRYLLTPEQVMALQRESHKAEKLNTIFGWLNGLKWFWKWRNNITVH